MNLVAFSEGRSVLHRIDPRIKVLVAATYSGVVAVAADLSTLGLALGLALAWVLWARLSPRAVMGRLLAVNGFVALLWILLPFTHPGTPVFRMGPLTASGEGLAFVTALTLRTNAIVLASMALLGTMSVFDLVHALHHLRVPGQLAQVAFFSFRYVYVIEREYRRLRSAMRIRCFRPRTGLHTYRSFAYLVGMLLVRSYERSQRVHQAMLCRGFQGTFPVYRHFRLERRDLSFGGVMLAAIIVLGLI
jgi:cobalt/nickel transport system permease protein